MKILISTLISAALLIGSFNIPAKYLSLDNWIPGDRDFGAFSTITSTDNLADFPTTYNANLVKTIEVGTTSVASITTLSGLTTATALASIGTITSGVWNGTAVTAAYGGTGSTTLSSNQVLLGNGTGIVKTVNGFGTSGQSLVSNGAATAPSWQSVSFDTAANYTNTGLWTFSNGLITTASSTLNATTTIGASSVFGSPLILNAISYAFPSVQGASSTVLSTNGSGVLTWVNPEWQLLSATTLASAQRGATTSVSARSQYMVVVRQPSAAAVAGNLTIRFNTSYSGYASLMSETDAGGMTVEELTGTGYMGMVFGTGGSGTTSPMTVTANIYASSTLVKTVQGTASVYSSVTSAPSMYEFAGQWNDSSNAITSITVLRVSSGAETFPAGTEIKIYGLQ